jgi:homocysteine S-methyltransferase
MPAHHPQSFADALKDRVLVFDGAMGTEIYRRHVFTNRCFDELCLSMPELIRQIHQDYAHAGADVLTTNTFGANRLALGAYGFEEKLRDINTAAVRLAREVAASQPQPPQVGAAGTGN